MFMNIYIYILRWIEVWMEDKNKKTEQKENLMEISNTT